MRWLVGHPGPHFSVADMHTGWAEALRGLGEQVFTFNLNDRLLFYDSAAIEVADGVFRKAMPREKAIETAAHGILSAAYQCWPDVVLLISAFFTPPPLLDMMRGRGHKIVLVHSESPYQDDEQLVRAASANLNLINDPTNLDRYQALGIPAAYMPHAYRPQVHYPDPGAGKLWDFAFVGTGFPSRVRFFEQMNLDGLDARFAGVWLDLEPDSPLRDWTWVGIGGRTDGEDCISNEETADIYRQSRTGINLYRREAEAAHAGEGWACGPREIELAACGTWFARDPRPESDELFPMLPSFTGPAEAGELIRWALAHPEDAAEAAAKARAAIAGRTFGNHARKLLALLGN